MCDQEVDVGETPVLELPCERRAVALDLCIIALWHGLVWWRSERLYQQNPLHFQLHWHYLEREQIYNTSYVLPLIKRRACESITSWPDINRHPIFSPHPTHHAFEERSKGSTIQPSPLKPQTPISMTSIVYLDTVPALPANAPLGCPHILDLSRLNTTNPHKGH